MPPTDHRRDPAEPSPGGAERERLATGTRRVAGGWKQWGPYVSERAWGTVREDYSADGRPWEYFPHDHARSRAYRWSEDGLAGICDIDQRLCFGLALWNGRDPILKERLFGLSGREGNHGEDAKEYWWYVDSTPTHSWMRWRYAYPQRAFPYADLVETNAARSRRDPEYELIDTGVFDDDRYWLITVDYAKAGPDDLCIVVEVHNAGPDRASIDVLPTLWFRNTWAWGLDERRPELHSADEGVGEGDGSAIVAEHTTLGRYRLDLEAGPGGQADLLFCDNDTNTERVFGTPGEVRFPKDGIGDHVVNGADTVNPDQTGTKAAARYHLSLAGGERVRLRMRLRHRNDSDRNDSDHDGGGQPDPFAGTFEETMAVRSNEADDFYRDLLTADGGIDGGAVDEREQLVARRAFAGMLWTKQFYHFDVQRWLDGDPIGPPPPPDRLRGRNAHWRHLNNHDIISMPDKWEYPWYAAWDLAFHCVTLARLDPDFAKHQLTLLGREWYMHPDGQLPAYEWSFGDVNPPVHAWAALRVFELDGGTDHEFLESLFHKLLINFTWWVNRKDANGNNVFEGGFLGLDNIGPFDRSNDVPAGGRLEQSDATAWMAMYCLNMLDIALVLAARNAAYQDVATKFFEHFAYIVDAVHTNGLWDPDLGFYRDQFITGDGRTVGIPAVSMVGLLPLFAVTTLEAEAFDRHADFAARVRWFLTNKPRFRRALGVAGTAVASTGDLLLAVVDPDRLHDVLGVVLDEERMLSPHGLRSLSKEHRSNPVVVELAGRTHRLGYEPAESQTPTFGGNSNWRGPIWFPLNFLAVEALRRYHRFLGDDFTVEHPTGSGVSRTLAQVADDLSDRLVALLASDAAAVRRRRLPGSDDDLLFHEYFHGDDGTGLGASHQTGWTGLVADLILQRSRTDRGRAQP